MKKKHSWRRRAGALALATMAGACSDVAPPDAPGGGGSGAMSAAGVAGAPSPGGATTGGASGAGGAPSGGADAGGVGVAGSAVIGGSSGSGGTAGGGGRAAEGGAGASGAAGSLGGETAGNGGATAGSAGTTAGTSGEGGSPTLAIAAELSGFRLECPCLDANHFGAEKQDNCDSAPAVDRQKHDKNLGGEPSRIYDVGLRVRGNTEPNTYVGGKLEQERFYVGGRTSTPGYTAYMMTVSDPPQTYFFNYNATTGHLHFLLDYQISVPMRGGAKVTFEVNGGSSVPDGHGVSNRERLVVPGVPPAPEPFNGQFVQIDVVSVRPRPEP